jgi:uncharacterized protein
MRTPFGAFIFILIVLLIDLYVFQAVKTVTLTASPRARAITYSIYWAITVFMIAAFLLFAFSTPQFLPKLVRTYLFAVLVGLFLAKITALFFLLIDDIRRMLQWIVARFSSSAGTTAASGGEGISRSVFLSWMGLATGSGLFGTLLYGFSNKYNYNIQRLQLAFENLPGAFKGLKIVQISDVHSGSFTDKKAVQQGIDKILAQKPDMILFTGDLVNDLATEMEPYKELFAQLKAPLGVYSTLGNHDYGDYVRWPDRDDAHREKERQANTHLLTDTQQKNLDELKAVHASMGWRLLLDEHIAIQKDGHAIALLGVQNISGKKGRFHSYGDLHKAYAGADKYPFKILMSHDPSHWEAQVVKDFPDIDLVLSGHTHGMQFGVEIPGFRWSPVQYIYKQWAGLYQNNKQHLYVNRGFGFIGYPGRVGILPEITVIELL